MASLGEEPQSYEPASAPTPVPSTVDTPLPARRRLHPWQLVGIVLGATVLACAGAAVLGVLGDGPDDDGPRSTANIGAAQTAADGDAVVGSSPAGAPRPSPTTRGTGLTPTPTTARPTPSTARPAPTKPTPTPTPTKPKPTREPPEPACDPNYTGACVPIAVDVDCAGGGGDGPAYVEGPVYVVGSDIYKLDSDGDGVGCDG